MIILVDFGWFMTIDDDCTFEYGSPYFKYQIDDIKVSFGYYCFDKIKKIRFLEKVENDQHLQSNRACWVSLSPPLFQFLFPGENYILKHIMIDDWWSALVD